MNNTHPFHTHPALVRALGRATAAGHSARAAVEFLAHAVPPAALDDQIAALADALREAAAALDAARAGGGAE